jgi:hypothetical protein
MKRPFFLLLILASGLYSTGQVNTPVRPALQAGVQAPVRILSFQEAIDSILRDFPNNLHHISGDLVLSQGEIDNYSSLVTLPGAEDCQVTRYHSVEDTTASWQGRMYRGDDFEKAQQCYHDLFLKLQGCYVMMTDSSLAGLQGIWEPARKDMAFTSSRFHIRTRSVLFREVRVEIELVYLMADWAVNINVYNKREDEVAEGGE